MLIKHKYILTSTKLLRTRVAQNALRIFVWREISKNKCYRDAFCQMQNLSQNAVFAVAGVAGFEPTHARIKILCLTAWRHPISKPNPFLSLCKAAVKPNFTPHAHRFKQT